MNDGVELRYRQSVS